MRTRYDYDDDAEELKARSRFYCITKVRLTTNFS